MQTATNKGSSLGSISGGEPWLEIVQQQMGSLKFGVVQIIVHESKVVQIERTEKVRISEQKKPGAQAQAGESERTIAGRGTVD